MFQFPTFASLTGWQAFSLPGCPIRISRDQGLFAPPPGFSQLITSFVASESQGIHRLPLPASGVPGSHGVTGGVYKARERIHRGMLIRDY